MTFIKMKPCLYFSFRTILLMVLFSQYLDKAWIPIPTFTKGRRLIRFRVFALFPVLLTILIMWAICGICTLADVQDPSIRLDGDKAEIFRKSKWFRFPYPCMILDRLKPTRITFYPIHISQFSGVCPQCQLRECLG